MVPILLYFLVKKYVTRKWPAVRRRMTATSNQKNVFLMIGFLVLMLLKIASLKAQETQLQYNILRNGKIIGWTRLVRTTNDQKVDIRLQSEVKTRFVFQFVVKAAEEAMFNNGSLVYTSQFRKLNADVKENKSMKLTNHGYEISKAGEVQSLMYSNLQHHVLGLYFQEPAPGQKFYSDSFQQLLDVQRIADGAYKVSLPDGNSCSYYYKNGVCTNVKIDHRFYSAELMLAQTVN
jgi:hypothetical protein